MWNFCAHQIDSIVWIDLIIQNKKMFYPGRRLCRHSFYFFIQILDFNENEQFCIDCMHQLIAE